MALSGVVFVQEIKWSPRLNTWPLHSESVPIQATEECSPLEQDWLCLVAGISLPFPLIPLKGKRFGV